MRTMFRFVLFVCLLLLTGVVSATEIYVGNKPYRGQVYRHGGDVLFTLPELSLALDISVSKNGDVWSFGGVEINTVQDSGTVWVKLKDLPQDLVRVVNNKELNTLDLFRSKSVGEISGSGDEPAWTSKNTLVYFCATWSPPCQNMASAVAELVGSRSMKVIVIDIDDYKSRKFKKYTRYFEGDKIPYFAVLSERGKKIHDFAGFHTYPGLLRELAPFR